MGFNKKYLPDLADLIKELTKKPERLEFYKRAEAWIGPSDSVQYLEKCIENSRSN